MLIIQTPLRVSLFGGGTDFPAYFLEHGGCVISSAIDKFIFVTIKQRFDQKLRVGWTRTEMVDSVDEIHHTLIREAFRKTGLTQGVEITTMGDIPSEGSGLGSSSTVTVGSLHAMYAHQRQLILSEKLAVEACEIERDILQSPIGMQDQYIAAYGGMRFIEFRTDGQVIPHTLELDTKTLRRLNDNLLLFFTGKTRKADKILSEQKANIKQRQSVLGEMKDIACTARDELLNGNVDAIGGLLHESWMLKKRLASQISNDYLDEMYETARAAGAIGGKIAGAGGGGFMLLYCRNGTQEDVRHELQHLQELPFKLGQDGSKVIFDYHR
ncbi:MAG: GHMP kinase [Ardenticatenaceae bacterium]|nr:GHMP kinase [Anaerolineales bacterium]MCB8923764.1 GHMP kinase [Ardenticatenaceae bacterium]MCB8990099.1 GHMP kinase [Ardenticatenaceae bacterium]